MLHVGPKQLGVLAGADGIGAIVVGAILTRRARGSRHGVIFLAGAFAVSLFVIVLAMSRLFALSWGTQVTLGLCSGMFGAMQPVLILNMVEVQMRARAMGMLAMAIGVGPFGILLTGVLSATIGTTWTITGMSLLALVLMAAVVSPAAAPSSPPDREMRNHRGTEDTEEDEGEKDKIRKLSSSSVPSLCPLCLCG